jgi:CBS domain-containing protein
MTDHVTTCHPDADVKDVLTVMGTSNSAGFLIVDEQHSLVGIVSQEYSTDFAQSTRSDA